MIETTTTSAAPRGKRCTRCLCCDAVIVFEGEALCAACDDGTHAPIAAQPQAESQPALTPQPQLTNCRCSVSEPQPRKDIMKDRRKFTPEELAIIAAAPASETARALADRLGADQKAVWYQRMVIKRKQANGTPTPRAPKTVTISPGANGEDHADWIPEPEATAQQPMRLLIDEVAKEMASGLREMETELRAVLNGKSKPLPTPPAPDSEPDFVPAHLSACHRPTTPSTAFLCFSEDELDDWWNGLDVEFKAYAFAGFSLRAQGQADSFIHIDDRPRIPVLGTIGTDQAAQG